MEAIDNCLVVWSARIFDSNRNDQEGEHTQLFMLDQIRILFKSYLFWTTKKSEKPSFPAAVCSVKQN